MSTSFSALRTLAVASVVFAVGHSAPANAQDETAIKNFNTICLACHSVGQGRRVGPDLQGVTQRRTEEWLMKFIKSSQTMIKEGDEVAKALFAEYAVPMPDSTYSEAEIKAIIKLLASGWTTGGGQAGAAVAAAEPEPTPEEIRLGRELFHGGTKLTNGGPTCSSCHHVPQDHAVIGGGILAKELSTAFTRLGGPGIKAILSAPPFPVMQEAYAKRPLTPDETAALGGYLKNVSKSPQSFDQPREDMLKLLLGGIGGLALLMVLYSFTWRRRKKFSVNEKIFARQVRSQ